MSTSYRAGLRWRWRMAIQAGEAYGELRYALGLRPEMPVDHVAIREGVAFQVQDDGTWKEVYVR